MKKLTMTQLVRLIFLFPSIGLAVFGQSPGSLDPIFGDGGLAYPPPDFANYYFWADDMRIQEDGKIVVSGVGGIPCYFTGDSNPNCETYVARFLSSGQLDPTFGSGGQVFVNPGRSIGLNYYGTNMALQPDGKIVVVGSYYEHYVMRFLPNGTLDSTFDGDGKLTFNDLFLGDVAVQPDGKIVLTGWLGQGVNVDFAAARLNTDGTFDNTFGVGGLSRTHFEGLTSAAYGIALQSDGKIVSIGSTSDGSNNNVALARYNTDGSVDASFGIMGRVVTDVPTDDTRDVFVERDGHLLVAGSEDDTGLIIRFNADGSFDTAFGNEGIVSKPGFPFYSIAVQRNGKIVAGGRDVGYRQSISRYLADGTEDSPFGEGGVVSTVFPAWGNLSFGGATLALAIQPNGKLLGAGNWVVGGCSEGCFTWLAYPTIARYVGDPLPPFDFDGDGRTDIAVFRPSDSVWYLNRSTQGFTAIQFGLSSDRLVPGDYDGDGKTDIAVFRDGVWWLMDSSDNSIRTFQFGVSGDVPVPADYTGDGLYDLAVFRTGQWWILDLTNGEVSLTNFGAATDKPVLGDFDGDRKADRAIFRPGDSSWWINLSSGGVFQTAFGLPTDMPVPGDYTGDGKTDITAWRQSTGHWYVLRSEDLSFFELHWGSTGDVPVPGDYDGDGKWDAAVFRPSNATWFINRTGGSSALITPFGLNGDRPLASVFVP